MTKSDGFLSHFKSNLASNFARAYLFYVKIDKASKDLEIPKNQKYLVRSASIPAHTLEEIAIPFQGMVFKLASTQTFDTWECTFNSDSEGKLRKFFVDWMNDTHNAKTNEHGKPTDYFGKITIELLNPFQKFGEDEADAAYTCTLYDAWPSAIAAIDLGYDSKEVGQFSVTWTYNWHEEAAGAAGA